MSEYIALLIALGVAVLTARAAYCNLRHWGQTRHLPLVRATPAELAALRSTWLPNADMWPPPYENGTARLDREAAAAYARLAVQRIARLRTMAEFAVVVAGAWLSLQLADAGAITRAAWRVARSEEPSLTGVLTVAAGSGVLLLLAPGVLLFAGLLLRLRAKAWTDVRDTYAAFASTTPGFRRRVTASRPEPLSVTARRAGQGDMSNAAACPRHNMAGPWRSIRDCNSNPGQGDPSGSSVVAGGAPTSLGGGFGARHRSW